MYLLIKKEKKCIYLFSLVYYFFFFLVLFLDKHGIFFKGKKQQNRGLFNLFFYLKKINKCIVTLNKWVSRRVFLFCRQCFSAS